MAFTTRIYSSTKKIFVYGSGTLATFFILLLGLSFYGVSVQTSGDQICGDTCISYFNISLRDYSLCFGSTFQGVYSEPNVLIDTYLKKSEIEIINYFCEGTRIDCFKLSKPSNGISTRCYYNESAPTKYKICNTGWKMDVMESINWEPYSFESNTCLDRNQTYEFKIIGHKNPKETIKWGLNLQGKDLDPFWYGENNITELFMELGSQVNLTVNLTI